MSSVPISPKYIDSGKKSAKEIMAYDAHLLKNMEHNSNSFVHFYDWALDSATYGYFVEPSDYLSLEGVKDLGVELARRPTGGGIVFHHSDFAFSVLVHHTHPSFSQTPLDNYNFINRHIIAAIERFQKGISCSLLPLEPAPLTPFSARFCMAKPTKYDVMIEGKKVGGAAQRKTRHGYLHQGTISLGMPPESYLHTLLLPQGGILEEMQRNTYALLGKGWTDSLLVQARQTLKEILAQIFGEVL